MRALEHAASRSQLSALPSLAADAFTTALDLVFPALCPICDEPLGRGRRDPLCGPCWQSIPRIAPPVCDLCGVPWPQARPALAPAQERRTETIGVSRPERGEAAEATDPPGRCAACVAHAPAYDWARAAARYDGSMRETLHALKFGGRRSLARPLADLVIEHCGAAVSQDVAAIVPVPLATDRERERGFNQAALIAERLARRLGVRLAPRWLTRVRTTRPQSELAAAERSSNVRDAFRASPNVRGAYVLLVDDVMTTGATVAECARAAWSAGAARIGVLTVARVL